MKSNLPDLPVSDTDEPVVIMRTDLKELTYRTFIEPIDDQVVHIYSAPRNQMVETGDIVFRRFVDEEAKFFQVVYACTLRYPGPVCGKVCSRLPYQLFLQMEQITNEPQLAQLRTDLAEMDAIPF